MAREVMKLIFAVLCMSLNDGPYTYNGSFFTFIAVTKWTFFREVTGYCSWLKKVTMQHSQCTNENRVKTTLLHIANMHLAIHITDWN